MLNEPEKAKLIDCTDKPAELHRAAENGGAGVGLFHLGFYCGRIPDFRPRENDQVRTRQGRNRLTQPPGGKHGIGKNILCYVNGHKIDGALKCKVLEPVVQDVNIRTKALFGKLPGAKAVSANDDWDLRQRARRS